MIIYFFLSILHFYIGLLYDKKEDKLVRNLSYLASLVWLINFLLYPRNGLFG